MCFTECKVCGPFFRGRLTCDSLFFLCLTDQAIQSSPHRVTKKGKMVSHPAFTQFEKPTDTWKAVKLLLKSALPLCTRFIVHKLRRLFIRFRYFFSLGTRRNEDLLPEVPTTQLIVLRSEGSGEELWGSRLVKPVPHRDN